MEYPKSGLTTLDENMYAITQYTENLSITTDDMKGEDEVESRGTIFTYYPYSAKGSSVSIRRQHGITERGINPTYPVSYPREYSRYAPREQGSHCLFSDQYRAERSTNSTYPFSDPETDSRHVAQKQGSYPLVSDQYHGKGINSTYPTSYPEKESRNVATGEASHSLFRDQCQERCTTPTYVVCYPEIESRYVATAQGSHSHFSDDYQGSVCDLEDAGLAPDQIAALRRSTTPTYIVCYPEIDSRYPTTTQGSYSHFSKDYQGTNSTYPIAYPEKDSKFVSTEQGSYSHFSDQYQERGINFTYPVSYPEKDCRYEAREQRSNSHFSRQYQGRGTNNIYPASYPEENCTHVATEQGSHSLFIGQYQGRRDEPFYEFMHASPPGDTKEQVHHGGFELLGKEPENDLNVNDGEIRPPIFNAANQGNSPPVPKPKKVKT